MTRNRAAAVVIHDNALLVMYRKNTEEYDTFPGGGVEAGETNEQAAIREIKEEASVDITVERLVYELHHDNGDVHFYFLSHYVSGTPKLQTDTNEYADNRRGDDFYRPEWLAIEDLPSTTLYPLEVRDRLITDLRDGFSNEVVRFNLKIIN